VKRRDCFQGNGGACGHALLHGARGVPAEGVHSVCRRLCRWKARACSRLARADVELTRLHLQHILRASFAAEARGREPAHHVRLDARAQRVRPLHHTGDHFPQLQLQAIPHAINYRILTALSLYYQQLKAMVTLDPAARPTFAAVLAALRAAPCCPPLYSGTFAPVLSVQPQAGASSALQQAPGVSAAAAQAAAALNGGATPRAIPLQAGVGLELQPNHEGGLVVTGIVPGSPSAVASPAIAVGDLLHAIDGQVSLCDDFSVRVGSFCASVESCALLTARRIRKLLELDSHLQSWS
jgi:hypothetical protein